jgi:hypothetical protein
LTDGDAAFFECNCDTMSAMETFWNRVPRWADWLAALALAVVVFNLNVTEVGDPLTGVGPSADPSTPGITEGARAIFYGALMISGAVLASVGLATAILGKARALSALIARTYGGVAFAGAAGLLLDYRDGPVRLVQLFVYVMLALAVIRFARVAIAVQHSSSDKSDERAASPA